MSSNRPTRKQRMRAKREREAAEKRLQRRGEVREARAESARERFAREQREREAARIAARRAEHALPDGKQWIVLDACTGRAAELCGLLRQAAIPFFRPQEEVEEVLSSGRRRMVKVPLIARSVFVGLEHRSKLARLRIEHPWLSERQPGRMFGGNEESGEFPWMVERVERQTAAQDEETGDMRLEIAYASSEQMQRFADCLIGSAPLLREDDSIKVGEKVTVDDGPFASFPGVVSEIDPDTSLLKVAVSIFGRLTPVELDARQVTRV
jgi:transcriptional antiterminator NusG